MTGVHEYIRTTVQFHYDINFSHSHHLEKNSSTDLHKSCKQGILFHPALHSIYSTHTLLLLLLSF